MPRQSHCCLSSHLSCIHRVTLAQLRRAVFVLCFHKELRIFSEQRCHDLKAACQSDYSTDSQTRLQTRLQRIREAKKGPKERKSKSKEKDM